MAENISGRETGTLILSVNGELIDETIKYIEYPNCPIDWTTLVDPA